MDPFWDVRAREAEQVAVLRRDIAATELEIELVRRVDALHHSPGYQDFLKAVTALRDSMRNSLIQDSKLTNDGLRELRGQVKALEGVLALLSKGNARQQLDARLKERQDQLSNFLKSNPRTEAT